MLIAGICMAATLLAIWRASFSRVRPLDRQEIRLIRRSAEQIRREQFHPFD